MDSLREFLALYMAELFVATVVIQLLLLILILAVWLKFHRIRRQQKQLLRGVTRDSLEQLIHTYTNALRETERTLDEAAVQLDELQRAVRGMKGRIGLVRYNALAEQGNELSFSLAIVDRSATGVVVSSLYGRDQSYVYAKPVVEGKSKYALSDEEKKALRLAREG